MKENNKPTLIDPMFDGHLEKPIEKMSTKEKLEYLSLLIEMKYYRDKFVKRVKK